MLLLTILLGAPLTAFAGRLTLAWDPSPEPFVFAYAVYYGTTPGTYTQTVFVGAQTTFTAQDLTNGVRYYFVVKAYTAAGIFSAASNEVSGVPVSGSSPFTDDPLSAGTVMKTVHITELRARINALRAARGLGAAVWTETLAAGSTPIKAVHITELRTSLAAVYASFGLSAPAYATDPTITPGSTVIKAVHLTELRNAVKALE